jgi:uncharacterized protein YdeI (BOF family)
MPSRRPPRAVKPPLLALLAVLLFAAAAAAEQPRERADQTVISISGTVVDVARNVFTLDHGEGEITVEFDDGDRDADAYQLVEGDKVTVSGVVDADLFEKATIEASRVYVQKLSTAFHASAIDEEDTYVAQDGPVEVSAGVLEGAVTAVHEDAFELYTGTRAVTVTVEAMPYDPLDHEGYQRIAVGDRVSVRGHVDHDLLDRRVFQARAVVTLSD